MILLAEASVDGCPSEEAFHLNVAIAYQNFECQRHALRAYESVIARFSETGDFKRTTWNFDLFRFPATRERAVHAALEADIVIVCGDETAGRDPGFSSWLEEWSEGKTNKPSALVALLADSANQPCQEHPLKTQLEAVAEKLGLDFFARACRQESSTVASGDHGLP